MTMLIGLIFAALVAQITTNKASDKAELTVVKGNSLFTKAMYNELATQDGNFLFSPFSAHAILSLVYQGANGETSNAFAKVLNVPDKSAAAKGYHQLLSRPKSSTRSILLMANKIYLMNKYKLKNNFNKTATEKFNSVVEKVNFAENVKTADLINHWVEEKTQNKIQDFIKADMLNADTRLVLVNAIYFEADWSKKFYKQNTKKQPFYINENDHVEVDMMHSLDYFNYKEDQELGAKILQLRFSSYHYKQFDSLIIILPNERTGIKNLEQKLMNTDSTQITKNLKSTYLDLSLPKFKIETTITLNDVLKNIGLAIIFKETEADFTKLIKGNKQLYVSEILQKAFIEVNEEGAQAGAVTAAQPLLFSPGIRSKPEYFNADHPFYIALIENDSNILFSGRFVKP